MARSRHPERPWSSRKHLQTEQIEPNRIMRVLDPDRTPKITKKVKSKLHEQLSKHKLVRHVEPNEAHDIYLASGNGLERWKSFPDP